MQIPPIDYNLLACKATVIGYAAHPIHLIHRYLNAMNNYLLLTDIGLTLQYRNARVGQECKNKPD